MEKITSLDQLDLSKQYSYADYITWLFDERIELLKGFIRKIAAPNRKHQEISFRLSGLFSNFLSRKKCKAYAAPFDVRLLKNPQGKTKKEMYTVVQPDLCVICDRSKLDDAGCVGAPDLIIEIVSPKNSAIDVTHKFALYQEACVLEYWIIYPYENTLHKFVLENEKYVLEGIYTQENKISTSVLEGLEIDLSEVFEEDEEEIF
ncbi:MAG: Uma2 family endonuclease [Bacteroidetes bacterium]|nr:MAG: Uma2 family endonuclease [Bacteroidota bacterium]